ncbi:WXG100 family type VII secretion target [Nocardia farcinica]|uniref:ESAT-6-like protein n=1 Tax=Nocardia farcinica (strain IFM 10152) TaxID=247156 RepID=Q5YRD8_NOCFA|nr:WXG100 family type VII secretion target [Nocardia farcinica]MBF6267179.1 WXG100 family type VII secretion target [Nocardia farcinica]MCZ9329944.1 WXG100 family type VII secretion target [Nocardia farcinica]BAD59253.1 hypothetical protein NFA_44025 [Nocardia farcinica IFM 10152]
MTGEYSVDLAALEDLTARLRGYHSFVLDNLGELRRQTESLSTTWTGAAAEAFAAAHLDWNDSVAYLTEGLERLESASVHAYQSYSNVVEINRKMVGRRA